MDLEFQCCETWLDYPTPGKPVLCPDCNSILAVRSEDHALLALDQSIVAASRA